ncbi:MAG: two-component system chemotaxis response regulator CheY [Oleiphilaceae bacterium]|jgi:two-component system chemotaxis response regulator CheY
MKTIFLIDDSVTMLMSLESVLKRAGFNVITATSGSEALSKIPSVNPDLVITDLNMPGMDGITVIKEVKKITSMRFKPVLMLTTESQGAKRDEAKAAGAKGWLVKPIKPEELIAVVKQVVPGS